TQRVECIRGRVQRDLKTARMATRRVEGFRCETGRQLASRVDGAGEAVAYQHVQGTGYADAGRTALVAHYFPTGWQNGRQFAGGNAEFDGSVVSAGLQAERRVHGHMGWVEQVLLELANQGAVKDGLRVGGQIGLERDWNIRVVEPLRAVPIDEAHQHSQVLQREQLL